MNFVWIFHGPHPQFASGVFANQERAEEWVALHQLSGLLTRYPLDEGAYQWAVSEGTFKPKRDDQKTASFIARFADSSVHHHYEAGTRRT